MKGIEIPDILPDSLKQDAGIMSGNYFIFPAKIFYIRICQLQSFWEKYFHENFIIEFVKNFDWK